MTESLSWDRFQQTPPDEIDGVTNWENIIGEVSHSSKFTWLSLAWLVLTSKMNRRTVYYMSSAPLPWLVV